LPISQRKPSGHEQPKHEVTHDMMIAGIMIPTIGFD
jgi:hypothetical protein